MSCFANVTLSPPPGVAIKGQLVTAVTNISLSMVNSNCQTITSTDEIVSNLSTTVAAPIDKLVFIPIINGTANTASDPHLGIILIFLSSTNAILGAKKWATTMRPAVDPNFTYEFIIEFTDWINTTTGFTSTDCGFIDSTLTSSGCYPNNGSNPTYISSFVTGSYKVAVNGHGIFPPSSSGCTVGLIDINTYTPYKCLSIPDPCNNTNICSTIVPTPNTDPGSVSACETNMTVSINQPLKGLIFNDSTNGTPGIDTLNTAVSVQYKDSGGNDISIPVAFTYMELDSLDLSSFESDSVVFTLVDGTAAGLGGVGFVMYIYTKGGRSVARSLQALVPEPAGWNTPGYIIDYTQGITNGGFTVNEFGISTSSCDIFTSNINTVKITNGNFYRGVVQNPITCAGFPPGIVIGPVPASCNGPPICFKGGTLIKTDDASEGKPIEQITLDDTIDGYKVKALHSCINEEGYMILIKKNAIDKDVPDRDTYTSRKHGIYIGKQYAKAQQLINGTSIINYHTGKIKMYNVLLEDKVHGVMYANNMKVETMNHRTIDKTPYRLKIRTKRKQQTV